MGRHIALLRFLFVVALAFGSVMPPCLSAAPMPLAAHHAGMAHDQHQPAKAHISDACIGCATPLRFMFTASVAPMVAASRYAIVASMLTTYDAAREPPPPRIGA